MAAEADLAARRNRNREAIIDFIVLGWSYNKKICGVFLAGPVNEGSAGDVGRRSKTTGLEHPHPQAKQDGTGSLALRLPSSLSSTAISWLNCQLRTIGLIGMYVALFLPPWCLKLAHREMI